MLRVLDCKAKNQVLVDFVLESLVDLTKHASEPSLTEVNRVYSYFPLHGSLDWEFIDWVGSLCQSVYMLVFGSLDFERLVKIVSNEKTGSYAQWLQSNHKS